MKLASHWPETAPWFLAFVGAWRRLQDRLH